MNFSEKQELIKKEIARLTIVFKEVSKRDKNIIDGLIKRAGFMRVTLEIMENDLDINGFVEMFSQSEKTDPYERERPIARLYNTMNKNYQGIIKQLADFVGKEPAKVKSDGFDDFVNSKK